MKRREILAGSVAIGTSLAAGCLSGGDGGGAQETEETMTTAAEAETMTPTEGEAAMVDKTIRMVDTSFKPLKTEVDTGAKVEWVNNDSFGHDVTSAQFSDGAAPWDFMSSVSAGGSTTYTFEEKGIYEYYCTIHSKGTMCGVVLVGDVSYGGRLPCENEGGGY